MTVRSSLVLCAAAVLLLDGCSRSGDGAGAAKTATAVPPQAPTHLNPCALITKEDAGAVLGTTVNELKPQGLTTADSCQYIDATAQSVTLQIHYGGAAEYDTYLKSAEDVFKGKAQPVTGLGDKAATLAGQLIVVDRPDLLVVTVGKRASETENTSAAKGLAQTAVARRHR